MGRKCVEDSVMTTDTACGRSFKPDWYCSRDRGHDGPCALWPISHEAADLMNRAGDGKRHHTQTRIDSFMESITNTAIGFAVSLVTWHFVAQTYGIPMPLSTNLQITAVFTIVSIIRQYVLRRAFDGRSPWQAMKSTFRACVSPVSRYC